MEMRCMRLLLTLACVFWSAILFAETIEKNSTVKKSRLAIYNTTSSNTGGYARKKAPNKTDNNSDNAGSYVRERVNDEGSYKIKTAPQTVDGYVRKNTPRNEIRQDQKETFKVILKNIDYNTLATKPIPILKTEEKVEEKNVKYLSIADTDKNIEPSNTDIQIEKKGKKTLPLSLFQQAE